MQNVHYFEICQCPNWMRLSKSNVPSVKNIFRFYTLLSAKHLIYRYIMPCHVLQQFLLIFPLFFLFYIFRLALRSLQSLAIRPHPFSSRGRISPTFLLWISSKCIYWLIYHTPRSKQKVQQSTGGTERYMKFGNKIKT